MLSQSPPPLLQQGRCAHVRKAAAQHASPPVHGVWGVLQCLHHIIYDMWIYERLIPLDVDYDVIAPRHLGHCLMTPLCPCTCMKSLLAAVMILSPCGHALHSMQSSVHRHRKSVLINQVKLPGRFAEVAQTLSKLIQPAAIAAGRPAASLGAESCHEEAEAIARIA